MKDAAKGECKCPDHPWNMWDAMEAIRPLFPKAADFAWFNAHGAVAPCHQDTQVGKVRVSYWGNGFQMIHAWYSVSVTFHPCVGPEEMVKKGGEKKENGPGKRGPERDGNDSPSSSELYAHLDEGVRKTESPPTRVSPPFVNNPSFTSHASEMASVIGVPLGDAVPMEAFSYTPDQLQEIALHAQSGDEADREEFQKSYDAGAEESDDLLAEQELGGYLDRYGLSPLSEALGIPPSGGGGGGSSGGGTGCGALGIEFVLGAILLRRLRRRRNR